MPTSFPAIITVPDEGIAALREALGLDPGPPAAGAAVDPRPGERDLIDLPASWKEVDTRQGETYSWPQGDDIYDPFTVYEATTVRGSIQFAIGRCRRFPSWGKERLYLITFLITAGGKRPLCEFLEADDYEHTREMVAIIRGTGASKRGMYDPSTPLPGIYGKLRTGIYRDFITVPRSWDRKAVIATEDDIDTMLNHSLVQADLRFGIAPS